MGGPGQPRRGDHLGDETLSRLVDGDLDAHAVAAAETHLATCADCRRDLDALRSTVAMLRTLPEARPRRSLQLGPEHAPRPAAWRRFAGALIPAVPALRAAALALVLVLGGITAAEVLRRDASDQVGNRAEATVASSGAVAAPTTLPTMPPDTALQRAPETVTAAAPPPTVAAEAASAGETPIATRAKAPTRSPTVAATRGAAPGDAPLPVPTMGTEEADSVFSSDQSRVTDGPEPTATAPSGAGGAAAGEPTDSPEESAPAAASTEDGAAGDADAGRSGDADSTEEPGAGDAAADSAAEADDATSSAPGSAPGADASTEGADDETDREETSDASSQSAESATASSAQEPASTPTSTPQPTTLPATPPGSPVASPVASPIGSPNSPAVASPGAEGRVRPVRYHDSHSDLFSERRLRLLLAAALLLAAGTVLVVGRTGRQTWR